MAETVFDFNKAILSCEIRDENIKTLKKDIFSTNEFYDFKNKEIPISIDGEEYSVPRKELLLNIITAKPFVTFNKTFSPNDWMSSDDDLNEHLDNILNNI